MTKFNSFFDVFQFHALLSLGERLYLERCAARVPASGTIVEIGSYTGGSAGIMRAAAPSADIYLIDIADMLDPKNISKDQVNFFQGDAAAFVENHPDLKIDLLLIDADHSLKGILNDYKLLSPMLKPNALLAFHDCCDMHELQHVNVFCDELVELNCFSKWQKVDSLFVGQVPQPPAQPDLHRLLRRIASQARESTQPQHALFADIHNTQSKVQYIGTGKRGKDVAFMAGLDFSTFINSEDVTPDHDYYVICSYYFEDIKKYLMTEKSIEEDRILNPYPVLAKYTLDDILNDGTQSRTAFNDPASGVVLDALQELPASVVEELYEKDMLLQMFISNYRP